jgi:hypothetical protein
MERVSAVTLHIEDQRRGLPPVPMSPLQATRLNIVGSKCLMKPEVASAGRPR